MISQKFRPSAPPFSRFDTIILFGQVASDTRSYLVNNPRMFNHGIDDLVYKIYLHEFVGNVLRDDIGILIFDLHIATAHFGTVGWTKY